MLGVKCCEYSKYWALGVLGVGVFIGFEYSGCSEFSVYLEYSRCPPLGTTGTQIGKTYLGDACAFVGLFVWEMCLNNRFKSSGKLF